MAGAWGWPQHLQVPNVMKSGSLNFLEPSEPHRACYGTALPLHPFQHTYILLTLCQRTAVSFTTLLPTDFVLPTEIMNAFLFCENWQRKCNLVHYTFTKRWQERKFLPDKRFHLHETDAVLQGTKSGWSYFPLFFPHLSVHGLFNTMSHVSKIVSIYSVVKKLNQAPDIKALGEV
jgi:hypothetical protein